MIPDVIDRGSFAYGVFLATVVYGALAWVLYHFTAPDDGVKALAKRKRSEGKSHLSNGV